MSDPPDLEELARRYLDLWQSQMAAVASDPQMADTVTRLIGLWTANAAGSMPALWPGMAPQQSDDPHVASHQDAAPAAAASSGAAPAADASRAGGVDMDELARRLATLEKRIARLEAGSAGKRRRAPAKGRKNKK